METQHAVNDNILEDLKYKIAQLEAENTELKKEIQLKQFALYKRGCDVMKLRDELALLKNK